MKTLTLLSLLTHTALAANVNFDALAPFASVNTQYAAQGIAFGAPYGADVIAAPLAATLYGTSAPNAICSTVDGNYCTAQMHVAFSSPASAVSFLVAAIDNPAQSLTLSIDHGPDVMMPLSPGSGAGYIVTQYHTQQYSAVLVTLTAPGISTIDFVANTDPVGLVFDDFSFTLSGGPVEPVGSVPEPSTLALVGLGLLAMRLKR